MKKYFYSILFFSIFFSIENLKAQQITNSEIERCIVQFFNAFTKGDTLEIKKYTNSNMTLQTVFNKKNNVSVVNENFHNFLIAIAKPKKEKWIEKITSVKINSDNLLANAWCTYEFYVDSTLSHCGTDNIQLYKDLGKWRILSITDTRFPCQIIDNDKNSSNNESVNLFQSPREEANQAINLLLDNWHKAAATADEKIFFNSMSEECIYLGTDKKEYWTKKDFETWSKKYFEKEKAWDFKPYNRNIYYSENFEYAWFDELLNTWMGVCRGSGVLHFVNGEWKLMQYNLAVTVPNEKIKQFKKINK